MSVNRPVNESEKDADISRKLQLYGIVAGFQNGKLPSNDQVDIALNSFIASTALSKPPDALSADGKRLVADVGEVVRHVRNLILSKNQGNLLQDFIWQTRRFDPASVSGVNQPVDRDSARQDGNQALEGLRTLGTLLITNGQFRKLLQDSTILFRDMIGDAATNAATRVRPSEDQLSQIDQPADDNTWHDAPDLSVGNLKKQAGKVYGGNAKADAQEVVGAAAGAGDTGAAVDAADSAARQKVDANMDDDAKEKLRVRNEEYKRRAREYLQKKMPQERRDQSIWRLKKMVLECQQHPEYARAIQTLLDLAEQYGRHGRTLAQESSKTAKGTRSSFGQAEADLKTLIERCANGTSTDDLWASIGQIYKDTDQDDELRDWFLALDRYVRRCLLEQGYILEDSSTQEWDALHDRGRYLLREKYRSHTDRVLDEVRFLADQFDQDPQNQALRQSIEKLFSDLGHDQAGNVEFKPHLIKDLVDVILPAALAGISYVPIPRIEYSDSMVDAVVENLVIESDNFMPNVAEIYSENYFTLGRKTAGSSHRQTFDIKVRGVQMDLRDVSYYIRRKKGFPAITDQGVANILLPGDGLSFHIRMSSADKTKGDSQKFFKVDKVEVDLKHLKIKFVQSKHKLLLSLLKPLVIQGLRPALQSAISKTLKEQASQLDELLYQVKQDADMAAKQVQEDPAQAPTVYSRYTKALQDRLAANKAKAQEAVSDKRVNVAITREESIFPDVKLPGGISTKATEYRQMAREGDKWESRVFSIGSAPKSTDVPVTPKIERKPHSVAQPNPQPLGYGQGNGQGDGQGLGQGNNPVTGANRGASQAGTGAGAGAGAPEYTLL